MEAIFLKFRPKLFRILVRFYEKSKGPIGSAVLTFIGYKQTNKKVNCGIGKRLLDSTQVMT